MKLQSLSLFIAIAVTGCQPGVAPRDVATSADAATPPDVTMSPDATTNPNGTTPDNLAAPPDVAPPPKTPPAEEPTVPPEVSVGPQDPGQAKESAGKLVRTEEEWRAMLSREAYHVLREKGTEAPFTNEYDHHFEPGAYACAACGQVLFESDTKFNSGCGWPAFYAAKAGDRVKRTTDLSHGMVRTEVTCARCDSHLGHVFDDAPQTPTGERFCINSVSLKFIPAEK
jgi:peptide-methionine (R)-S-oxide reductase